MRQSTTVLLVVFGLVVSVVQGFQLVVPKIQPFRRIAPDPSVHALSPHQLMLVAGGTGLVSQFGGSQLLKSSKQPKPGYTSHTITALIFMGYMSTLGWMGWCRPGSELDPRRLAAVVAGMIGIWDVPVSLWIKDLRKVDVIVHHILMAVIAYLGAVCFPTPYVFFYLGLSELSSIPLLLLDQLNQTGSARAIKQWKSPLEALTAVAFTLVRVGWFTQVTVFRFVPDMVKLLSTAPSSKLLFRFLIVASLAFTCLQLYWFYTQILKAVWRPSDT